MKLRVFCTFAREKLHKWDGAAEHKEVAYLANLHRHVFHFKVEVQVFHDNREVEFIMLKHALEAYVDSWGPIVGSCEMMAMDLVRFVEEKYKDRKVVVAVMEDGENGSVVEDGYD